jgi:hypothetical protein
MSIRYKKHEIKSNGSVICLNQKFKIAKLTVLVVLLPFLQRCYKRFQAPSPLIRPVYHLFQLAI